MNFQYSSQNFKQTQSNVINIPPSKKFFIYSAVILCGIYFPMFLFDEKLSGILSIITVFFCGSLLFASSKKTSVLVSTGIILFFIISLFNSLRAAALFLCLLIAVGAGGYLIFLSNRKNAWLFPLLPVISFAMVFVISKDLMLSSLSLMPYPAVFVQGIMLRRKASKLSTVGLCSLTLIVTLVIAITLYLISINASISDFIEAIDILRGRLVDFFAEYHITGADGKKIYLFQSSNREEVRFALAAVIDNLFNILPAILTIVITAFFYLTHSYSISLCENSLIKDELSPEMKELSVPLSVSVVFLAAFAISLTTDASGKDMLPTVVARNIYMILSPPLFIMGLSKIIKFVKGITSKTWIIIVIAAIFVSVISISATLCVFLGAGALIVDSAKKWADKGT